jgi:hypothetical protein
VVDLEVLLRVAVMVEDFVEFTAKVVTSNVPDLAPEAMDRVVGIVINELFAASFTTTPPPGAALEIFTVPVAVIPPTRDDGETETDDTV